MAETKGINGVNGTANSSHMPALCLSAEDFMKNQYDFVIVGGGTAGLTVAARLTENPDVTVGVLEAGGNKLGDPLIDTPATFPMLYNKPEYDWIFKTVPQKQNRGLSHHIPRGKILGGSSGINYMVYVRGSSQDYDDWAQIVDDASWGSAEMNTYMRKHQTLEPIDEGITDRSAIPIVSEFHGTSGPVHTSFNTSAGFPIEADFVKAADEVTGFDKKPKDPWSGDHIGFFNTLGAVVRTGPNKGKRSYAARGYFAANAHRPNLHVLCDALVHRVELSGDKATGVTFEHVGIKHTVQVDANREIIVSCGAIQSPQILELSGIGDPEILRAADVECKIANHGVGQNFQDHPLTLVAWEMTSGNIGLDIMYDPEVMAGAQKQYMEEQSGPLSSIASVQGFFPYKLFATQAEQDEIIKSIEDSLPGLSAFQRKQYERIIAHLKDDKSANVQLIFLPATLGFEHSAEDQSQLFPPPKPNALHQAAAAICIAYPASRGTVHIKSADAKDHPTIDPGFLTHPADAAVLAAGLRMVGKVGNSKALHGKISSRIRPPPEVDLDDLEQGKKWAYDSVMSEYHHCGSCAMGDVVDSRLRVKGVRGLRVVDASVFPNHVSGNIVSSVYAVAEKAADMIKADWDHAPLSKVA